MRFLTLLLLSACASGPCVNQVNAQDNQATAPQSSSSTPSPTDKVRVTKPDGSRQCGQGKPIDLKVMEAQLKKAGVKVLSSEKRPDGMMHPQVCGAPTGTVNSFEITLADLPKAEKLGFRRWQN